MTQPIAPLLVALAAGIALGLLYFSALWASVRSLPGRSRPVPWFLATAAVRLTVAAAAFAVVMDGSWQRALACLAGFLIGRQLLIRRVRNAGESAAE